MSNLYIRNCCGRIVCEQCRAKQCCAMSLPGGLVPDRVAQAIRSKRGPWQGATACPLCANELSQQTQEDDIAAYVISCPCAQGALVCLHCQEHSGKLYGHHLKPLTVQQLDVYSELARNVFKNLFSAFGCFVCRNKIEPTKNIRDTLERCLNAPDATR